MGCIYIYIYLFIYLASIYLSFIYLYSLFIYMFVFKKSYFSIVRGVYGPTCYTPLPRCDPPIIDGSYVLMNETSLFGGSPLECGVVEFP